MGGGSPPAVRAGCNGRFPGQLAGGAPVQAPREGRLGIAALGDDERPLAGGPSQRPRAGSQVSAGEVKAVIQGAGRPGCGAWTRAAALAAPVRGRYAGLMSDFLDVAGASGTAYRFRRASLDALPATAGNLIVARPGRAGAEILLCAAAGSLSGARAAAAAALKGRTGAAVFVRLNVARAVRETEHADIVAAAAPRTVIAETD